MNNKKSKKLVAGLVLSLAAMQTIQSSVPVSDEEFEVFFGMRPQNKMDGVSLDPKGVYAGVSGYTPESIDESTTSLRAPESLRAPDEEFAEEVRTSLPILTPEQYVDIEAEKEAARANIRLLDFLERSSHLTRNARLFTDMSIRDAQERDAEGVRKARNFLDKLYEFREKRKSKPSLFVLNRAALNAEIGDEKLGELALEILTSLKDKSVDEQLERLQALRS